MENKSEKEVSRRNFFKITTLGIGGALTFLMGYPLIDFIVSNTKTIVDKAYNRLKPVKNIPGSYVPVTKPSRLHFTKTDQDAFIKITEPTDVWVVKKSAKELTVFSPVCPHLGCRYNWDQEKELFICPCHNSIYNIEGKLISGPAPRGLDTLPYKIEDEDLYVLYERFEVGIPQKIIIGY